MPSQGADLAAAGTGHHGQPQEQAPIRVGGPRLAQQAGGFRRGRRVRLGRRRRRRPGQLCPVHRDLIPPDGASQGGADDEVDLPATTQYDSGTRVFHLFLGATRLRVRTSGPRFGRWAGCMIKVVIKVIGVARTGRRRHRRGSH
jgi:hypothetical protein